MGNIATDSLMHELLRLAGDNPGSHICTICSESAVALKEGLDVIAALRAKLEEAQRQIDVLDRDRKFHNVRAALLQASCPNKPEALIDFELLMREKNTHG